MLTVHRDVQEEFRTKPCTLHTSSTGQHGRCQQESTVKLWTAFLEGTPGQCHEQWQVWMECSKQVGLMGYFTALSNTEHIS